VSLTDFLTTVVRVLEESGVPYMLTGSLAAAYYAMPRATQDLDVVVDAPLARIDQAVDRLLESGLYVSREAAHAAYRTRGQFNAVDAERGWKVDLIIRKDRSFSLEEFSRRSSATVLGVEVSLTRIEDLILAKLEWSRLGESELQRRDVVQLLEAPWASLDRSYLERWVEELGLRAEWTEVLGQVS